MLVKPTIALALASASALAAAKGCQYGDLRNATWNLDVYEEDNCNLPSHSPQKHEWFGGSLTPGTKKWTCSPCGELMSVRNKVGSWVFRAENHLWLSWYNNKGCKDEDVIYPSKSPRFLFCLWVRFGGGFGGGCR
ncbi:hypothetical protein BV22DRAFT_1036798 [Leucogyrophana mollusca]|uniref:Uncharacterized protein n=1 Tax=Leucogyrophana mollusca TaxID=85980 RepID=A0ACB8BCQ6_9AGAM|nr:hypothetical protein BV22DRAFT_1036798 [Leucogyrophana mollusca]